MGNIKILDCTLRDGGYINDWNFGLDAFCGIVSSLDKSGVDFIEAGFLENGTIKEGKTLFNSITEVEKQLPLEIDFNKLFLMITYDKFDIENIPLSKNSKIKGLRLIFKKHQTIKALYDAQKLKEKGYKLFINPTFIDQFSDSELIEVIKKVNVISPYALSIVDSMGILDEDEIIRLFNLIDNNLNPEISLCFHPHNNLQLSFSNAKHLITLCKNRELIIDSSVFGMGRCAGNLAIELILEYLNKNYNKNYNLEEIYNIFDKYIHPIYALHPWGYNFFYYLSAKNLCHPNYAKYCLDKNLKTVETEEILKSIPNDKKAVFDPDFIKNFIENLLNSNH